MGSILRKWHTYFKFIYQIYSCVRNFRLKKRYFTILTLKFEIREMKNDQFYDLMALFSIIRVKMRPDSDHLTF